LSKRNYIEEITSIKDRSKFPGRFELMGRLSAIDSIIYNLKNDGSLQSKEVLKYIPIATVACFESFFRSIVAELINKGEPYSQNVLKFNQSKNIKFDFNIVNAIQKKKISVGDLVSHILNCNNIKDFITNLSILTQMEFLEELKVFEPKSLTKRSVDTAKKFKNKSSPILESVDYVFRLRHIFCHEFATNIELEYLVVKGTYEHCKIFLFHVNDFIWNLLEPDAPLTQTEMNIRAAKDFEKAESELSKVIDEIKSLDLSRENIYLDNKDFDLIIEKWQDYREVKAESFAKHSKGGTIFQLLKLNSLKATTEKMIAELIEEYGLKKASR
jgi:Lysozyme inhibitor LprI